MLPTLSRIIIIAGFMAATAISAFAAEGRSNQSEIIVWGFLGLCALIILAQIAPMLRNFKKHSRMSKDEAKAVKLQQL